MLIKIQEQKSDIENLKHQLHETNERSLVAEEQLTIVAQIWNQV
jgi:hypothetical protein